MLFFNRNYVEDEYFIITKWQKLEALIIVDDGRWRYSECPPFNLIFSPAGIYTSFLFQKSIFYDRQTTVVKGKNVNLILLF